MTPKILMTSTDTLLSITTLTAANPNNLTVESLNILMATMISRNTLKHLPNIPMEITHTALRAVTTHKVPTVPSILTALPATITVPTARRTSKARPTRSDATEGLNEEL